MLIIFSILGSLGNIFTLCIYLQKETTIPIIFIRTLAANDFIACTVTIPLTIWMEYHQFMTGRDILCRIYNFMVTCNIPFAAILMVPIAVDRYCALCKPFARGISKAGAYCTIVCIFICSAAFGSIVSSGFKVQYDYLVFPSAANASNITNSSGHIVDKFIGKCFMDSDSYDYLKIFQIIYALVYAVAVVVTLVIYAIIYYHIIKWQRERTKLFNGNSENHDQPTVQKGDTCCHSTHVLKCGQSASKHQAKDMAGMNFQTIRYDIKLAFMLFTISIIFIIAYLPAWLAALRLVEYIPEVFYVYFVYNVVHPVTYVVMDNQIRDRINNLCIRSV